MWSINSRNRKRKYNNLISKSNETNKFKTNGHDDSEKNIYSKDNHIYYYADVTETSCFELNKKIMQVTNDMLQVGNKFSIDPPPIYLHIKSYGGVIFDAITTIDTIKSNRVPIYSVIEGCAASAGTLISVVAHKRFIRPNAYMLIHQLSSGFWGTMSEIQDDYKNLNELMSFITRIYKEHTKVPKKKLEEILKHDIWWDAKKCLSLKLVDEIME